MRSPTTMPPGYARAVASISFTLRRRTGSTPNTRWKRIRCKRGRGTRAARHCMNSSGDMTIWAVPVFERALQLQHHLAGAVTLEPFVGDRRANTKKTSSPPAGLLPQPMTEWIVFRLIEGSLVRLTHPFDVLCLLHRRRDDLSIQRR